MSTQKRPLSGTVDANTGAAVPKALGVAPVVIHTLGSVPSQNGGPFLDDITLELSNTTGGAKVVDLVLGGVAFMSVSVPANGVLEVLTDIPFASARDAAASTLTAACAAGAGVFAYGWFARVL